MAHPFRKFDNLQKVIVIESKAYEKLKKKLFEFLNNKFEEMNAENKAIGNEWLSVKETMELLSVGRTKQISKQWNIKSNCEQLSLRY